VDPALLELLGQPVDPVQGEDVQRENARGLLDTLPASNRELLKLKYGLGYELDEVAKQMEISPAQASELHQDCLRLMRNWWLSRKKDDPSQEA
jgi:DNA-directed RNA polymerase specialized sigma24 family protein